MIENHLFERDVLVCSKCGKCIVRCRACNNYAKWDFVTVSENGKAKRKRVNHQFCAEHQHAIPNFKTVNESLEDPSKYLKVYNYSQKNLSHISRIGGITLASAAIFGPMSLHAARYVGGALGAAMGYKGAVATRVGLAALGGGSLAAGGTGMAGGTLVVTAVGASLGGALGAFVGNAYRASIEDFSISRVRTGKEPALITISGFLSQRQEGSTGWQPIADKKFRKHAWYHVEWEAKNLADLGEFVSLHTRAATLTKVLANAANSAGKVAQKTIGPAATAYQILQLSRNPWHVALIKSEQTGVLLADILRRCRKGRYVLVGHSLGCRVIASCLQALSTTEYKGIKQVHLLGGSVDNNREMWAEAAKPVSGPIWNYTSDHDMVLKTLYKVGSFFASKPIGIYPIDLDKVNNIDVSDFVGGHMEFKRNAAEFLN